jgi:hypothetical protein
MFCNACGTQLQSGFVVCPKCAQPIAGSVTPIPPAGSVPRSRLQQHLQTLGVLWIVVGVLFLIPSLGMLFMSRAARFVIHDNPVASMFGPLVLSFIGGTILIVAVGGILVGWGLRNREPWARTVAIALGILALFHPPFGTALGIYTLWVLLSNDARIEYRRLAGAA